MRVHGEFQILEHFLGFRDVVIRAASGGEFDKMSVDVAPQWGLRQATHAPSSEGPRGQCGHVPGALDEIPEAGGRSAAAGAPWGMDMIIGRSLTPLNSSRTMGGVRLCDDNSRRKVQNFREHSSASRADHWTYLSAWSGVGNHRRWTC